ncbi:chaplin [Streptomyces sp. NPDC046915]|uniref:chaplin n=1 Tax=Streptomyces sp. NPDC046915 TaxID=3155257 RepID=UPI0033C51E1F
MCRGVLAAAAATGILSLSYSSALADTNAAGSATDSPGVLAGNSVQAPVDAPVNVCGDTVNGVAALNTAFGNDCENDAAPGPSVTATPTKPTVSVKPSASPSDDCDTPTPSSSPTPPTRVVEKPRPTPPPTRTSHTPPPKQTVGEPPQLAETGSKTMLATSAASAALIAGGVMMYRRGRAAAQR